MRAFHAAALAFVASLPLAACGARQEAALPTAHEVDEAVRAAYGDPKTALEFTERLLLERMGSQCEQPAGPALPSLVLWGKTDPDRPLRVGDWELRFASLGDLPRGTACLFLDVAWDWNAGFGYEGVSVCATLLTDAARAFLRRESR